MAAFSRGLKLRKLSHFVLEHVSRVQYSLGRLREHTFFKYLR